MHRLTHASLVGRAGTALASAALLVGLSSCGSGASSDPAPAPPTPKDVKVAGSVVSTAGSANEMEAVVPEPIKAEWTALGSKGSGVEHVQVAGDATATTQPADLTGDAAAQVTALTEQINASDSAAPGGRSALAGERSADPAPSCRPPGPSPPPPCPTPRRACRWR